MVDKASDGAPSSRLAPAAMRAGGCGEPAVENRASALDCSCMPRRADLGHRMELRMLFFPASTPFEGAIRANRGNGREHVSVARPERRYRIMATDARRRSGCPASRSRETFVMPSLAEVRHIGRPTAFRPRKAVATSRFAAPGIEIGVADPRSGRSNCSPNLYRTSFPS